jgi:hypothetical protein
MILFIFSRAKQPGRAKNEDLANLDFSELDRIAAEALAADD